MSVKVLIQGKDEQENKQTLFIDLDGKIRTGIVEYIKLIAQHNALDGVTLGTTTYNHLLTYPLPFHSNTVGNDYTETTLSVTAAAGSTASETGSVSQTFVATLRNALRKIRGDIIVGVTVYYVTDGSEGTVTIDSVVIEIGKIASDGTKTTIDSKTISVGRSTTNTAVTDAIFAIFQDKEISLTEGERLYLAVTVNFTLTVDATGSTSAVTRTATVRIDHYRGSDDTCVLLPVVM